MKRQIPYENPNKEIKYIYDKFSKNIYIKNAPIIYIEPIFQSFISQEEYLTYILMDPEIEVYKYIMQDPIIKSFI